ncbi:MAG: tetratricopeptide repeat protein [Bacteroidales bacterium]|nr:tetratricopeptide repeat protein [Bacteroidales bacterium]MCF8343997.1 tetratricopeptide repeat protein [Bacteroidales bacterium]MCF8350421.1 tetratricopeptide repeat protein [Bacteroidales bacterium]MCF8377672.1 tetratricopeptide repeat protein [Bacteroidales bacterium]MCF8401948.1 tetratricopeptide repeat protein [Bacteroidales bacterium]
MRQLLVYSVLLVLSMQLYAEEELDFITLDKETYRFYQERKWDSLINLGKEGLKQGFDYYYLRYRMGVAYYELENFGRAITHFEKAHEFNSTENSLLVYLYYANRRLNRDKQAELFAGQLPENYRDELIGYDHNFIDHVYIESGYGISDDEHNERWTDSSLYLEEQFVGNSIYTHAGLKFNPGRRISGYLGFSHLRIDSRKDFMYYGDLQLDSIVRNSYTDDYYYSYERRQRSFNADIVQSDLYLKLDVMAGRNWSFSPYLHYIRVDYSKIDVEYEAVEDKAIEYYDKVNFRFDYFDYIKNEYSFSRKDSTLYDYVAGLNVSGIFSNYSMSLGAGLSKLNFKKRLNLNAGLTYYPFGNLNFYGSTGLSWFSAYGKRADDPDKLIVSQMIGLKVFSFLWLEATYLHGDINDTYRNSAFVVYNIPDKIDYIAEADIIMTLTEKMELSLRYQFWKKRADIIHYFQKNNESPASELLEKSYTNQMVIGGLKWKF